MRARVAATGSWTDPDGIRAPAGEVHAWHPGTNQTVCGLSLHRSQLLRFAHIDWQEAQPATGGAADEVKDVCARCAAGMGTRRDTRRWTRTNPRP
jgi:hypothetical protein